MPAVPDTLSVRLTPALSARLARRQARLGNKASDIVRQALDAYLDPPGGQARPPARPQPDTAQPLKRATIRVPDYVDQEATARARTAGIYKSQWMAAAVQSAVSAEPVLTDSEQRLFETSIHELNAIGRNLNQIARALNQSPHETDRIKLKAFEQTSRLLDDLKAAQVQILMASRRSWGLSE